MSKPLVSIITPTIPARRDMLLNRCAPSVWNQTYKNIEHIVVSDGPGLDGIPWVFRHVDLGRNWRQFSHGACVGAIPRIVGTYLARGDYIGYLDDDDEFLPQHVEKLVAFIQRTGVDFVYSQFKRHWSDGRPPDIIGSDIVYGHIGTPIIFHKTECLLHGNWSMDGYGEDFRLVDGWVKKGLRYAHLPEVTVNVYKQV